MKFSHRVSRESSRADLRSEQLSILASDHNEDTREVSAHDASLECEQQTYFSFLTEEGSTAPLEQTQSAPLEQTQPAP
jgi:hypothetical protein